MSPQQKQTANHGLNPYAAPLYVSTAPDSPSAEPSPHPSSANLASLDSMSGMQQQQNAQQNVQTQQVLAVVQALLQQQQQPGGQVNLNALPGLPLIPDMGPPTPLKKAESVEEEDPSNQTVMAGSAAVPPNTPTRVKKIINGGSTMEPIAENLTTDQLIEQQLRQLNELFLQRQSSSDVSPSTVRVATTDGSTALNGTTNKENRRSRMRSRDDLANFARAEKKQVIFVIANYLVLFMMIIALSAELQSRLPQWMNRLQENYDSVQNCATDRDALIECLSNGDFSGLVASFLLWGTQSVAAKRIFLFGFDTPKKLWTVVYEALVTAVCWGISYIFIRRGLNPNTRRNFIQHYWKDAVYGSLAGFNAAFMKAVLKNLIPQDVALEALEGRQLRIFHWLGSLMDE